MIIFFSSKGQAVMSNEFQIFHSTQDYPLHSITQSRQSRVLKNKANDKKCNSEIQNDRQL